MLRLVLVLALAAARAICKASAQNRLARSAEIDAYLSHAIERDQDSRNGRDGCRRETAFFIAARSAVPTRRTHKPMAVDSIFRLASMTKPVTSAAVMMLVEARQSCSGRSYRALSAGARAPRSVRDVQQPRQDVHEAGPRRRRSRFVTYSLTRLGSGTHSRVQSSRQLIGGDPTASATALPLLHDPGTKWTYGESTRVLGRLVEKVSGQTLDRFLTERIFVPLGMNDTFVRGAGREARSRRHDVPDGR